MSQKKIKKEPLLLITWIDAGVISQGDWISLDEITEHSKPEKFLNQTCGWLLCEDKSCVVLAAQVAIGQKESDYDLVMRIPKSLIRSRKVLG